MKRKAKQQREFGREEKAAGSRRDREEIFEVGEEGMSLEELAEQIQVEPSEIVRSLFMKGIMLSMNQVLDKNTCKLVAGEYDLLVVDKEEVGVTEGAKKKTDFNTEVSIKTNAWGALRVRSPQGQIPSGSDHPSFVIRY